MGQQGNEWKVRVILYSDGSLPMCPYSPSSITIHLSQLSLTFLLPINHWCYPCQSVSLLRVSLSTFTQLFPYRSLWWVSVSVMPHYSSIVISKQTAGFLFVMCNLCFFKNFAKTCELKTHCGYSVCRGDNIKSFSANLLEFSIILCDLKCPIVFNKFL